MLNLLSLKIQMNHGLYIHSVDLLEPTGVAQAARSQYPWHNMSPGTTWLVPIHMAFSLYHINRTQKPASRPRTQSALYNVIFLVSNSSVVTLKHQITMLLFLMLKKNNILLQTIQFLKDLMTYSTTSILMPQTHIHPLQHFESQPVASSLSLMDSPLHLYSPPHILATPDLILSILTIISLFVHFEWCHLRPSI